MSFLRVSLIKFDERYSERVERGRVAQDTVAQDTVAGLTRREPAGRGVDVDCGLDGLFIDPGQNNVKMFGIIIII